MTSLIDTDKANSGCHLIVCITATLFIATADCHTVVSVPVQCTYRNEKHIAELLNNHSLPESWTLMLKSIWLTKNCGQIVARQRIPTEHQYQTNCNAIVLISINTLNKCRYGRSFQYWESELTFGNLTNFCQLAEQKFGSSVSQKLSLLLVLTFKANLLESNPHTPQTRKR